MFKSIVSRDMGDRSVKFVLSDSIQKFLFVLFLTVPALTFMPGNFKGQWIFTEYRESKLAALLITFWGFAAFFSFFSLERYLYQIKKLIRSSPFLLLFFLSSYSLVSSFWAVVPEAALYEAAQWISLTFMFLILACLFEEKKWLELAIYSIAFTFAVVTFIGIVQTFKNIPFLMPIRGTGYASTFGSKNACFLSIGSQIYLLFFIFGKFIIEKKRAYAFWTGACVVLELVFIAISLSRTAYAAITAGMFTLFMVALTTVPKDKKNLLYKGAVLSFLIILALTLSIKQIYPRYWGMAEKRISERMIPFVLHPANYLYKTARGQIILDTFAMIKDHPLGTGAGNWLFLYPLYYNHLKEIIFNSNKQIRKVHNDYVQYLAELGLPGFLSFIGLIFFQFKRLFSFIKGMAGTFHEKALAVCLTAQLVGVSIMLFFSFYLEFPYRKFLFVFLLTLIYTLTSNEGKKSTFNPNN